MTPATRINPITGKKQVLVQPPGMPAVWITENEICERCKPFNECLGFKSLSDKEWREVTEVIKETSKPPTLSNKIIKKLRNCYDLLMAPPANAQPKKRIIKPEFVIIVKYKQAAGEDELPELIAVLHKGKEQVHVREIGTGYVLGMEYGEDYILTFVRKGYITKKFLFITKKVPVSFQKAFGNGEIEPFHLSVSLEKQPLNQLVKYDQPVAVISYNKKQGAFIYTANRVKTVKQNAVEKKEWVGE